MTKEERKARISEIDSQLQALHAERQRLICDGAAELSGIKVGEKIEWKYGKGLRCGFVRGVKQWSGDAVILVVQTILKNGANGMCSDVYPYHNPRKVQV